MALDERACGRELSLKVDSRQQLGDIDSSKFLDVGALRCCKFILAALTDSQMAGQVAEKLHVAVAY